MIKNLDVGASAYRIGLAQYGEDPKVEFNLSTHQTKPQTLAAIERFRLRPPSNRQRNLGIALKYASDHFFTREAGGRAHLGAPQSLVVVSGGDSTDFVSDGAHLLKSSEITVYGMSAGASQTAIESVASPGFTFMSALVYQLKESLTTVKNESIAEGKKHDHNEHSYYELHLHIYLMCLDDSSSDQLQSFPRLQSSQHGRHCVRR